MISDVYTFVRAFFLRFSYNNPTRIILLLKESAVEAYRHVELLTFLLDETAQKIEHLQRTAMEHRTAQADQPTVAHLTAYYDVQAEQAWWKQAHEGLTLARSAFEQIAMAEDERSRFPRSAGS
jgi:hypothetical protein